MSVLVLGSQIKWGGYSHFKLQGRQQTGVDDNNVFLEEITMLEFDKEYVGLK